MEFCVTDVAPHLYWVFFATSIFLFLYQFLLLKFWKQEEWVMLFEATKKGDDGSGSFQAQAYGYGFQKVEL